MWDGCDLSVPQSSAVAGALLGEALSPKGGKRGSWASAGAASRLAVHGPECAHTEDPWSGAFEGWKIPGLSVPTSLFTSLLTQVETWSSSL